MREVVREAVEVGARIRFKRRRERLRYYNRGGEHRKQVMFHECGKRNRWVFGGNRSGKSECGAAEAVWLARGNHPYKTNRADVTGWVVSLSREVQREVAQAKVLSFINPDWIEDVVMVSGKQGNPKGGIIDYITIKNVVGGVGKIAFKSCEMGRDKFQGASLDFVWFDEEPPEDVYEECAMRVIDKKGWIFGTMTPLLGLTFVYDRIYLNDRDDDEVWHIFMEWSDNPYLAKSEIKRLTKSMTKQELESRRYGKFIAAGGLVYPEFDESRHVIEPFEVPKEWYDMLSIDPGLNNPLSCHWYACDGDDNVYVIAEHYAAGKDIGWHCARIKSKCKELGWQTDSFGRYKALIDSAANQHTLASSKSVSELFIEQGIQVNANVNKNLFAGIAKIKNYLKGKPWQPTKETNEWTNPNPPTAETVNWAKPNPLTAETVNWTKADPPTAETVNWTNPNPPTAEAANWTKTEPPTAETEEEEENEERMKPKLYIFRSCTNLIREIKGYWWGSGDSPRKRDDHALDELRYYIMSKPEWGKGKGESTGRSRIARDKARLIRTTQSRR